jgi:hypothetical protein
LCRKARAYLADIIERFDSFVSWTEWVVENGHEAPFIKAAAAARQAARNAVKGQPRDVVANAERDAHRDAFFLVGLFLDIADRVHSTVAEHSFRATLCAREIQLLLLQLALGEGAGRFADPPAENIARRTLAGSFRGRILAVRHRISDYLARSYLLRLAVPAIRRTYFADQPVLFQRDAEQVDAVVETAEMIADEYDDFAKGLPHPNATSPAASPADHAPAAAPDALTIDLGAAERLAKSKVREEASVVAQMAKVGALFKVDQGDAGWALARRALRRLRA